MVLPRKHYVVEVVEAALESRVDAVPLESLCSTWGLPEPCTPAAWVQQFEGRLVRLQGRLNRQLEELDHDAASTVRADRHKVSLYAIVWGLLTRLERACRRLNRPFASRAYQALFV